MLGLFKNAQKMRARFLFSFFCCFVLVGIAYEIWLHTIHTVIPNQVYRSAQLSPSLLKYYIKTQQIKSVINLRGFEPDAAWYRGEIATTTQMGISHYDLKLSAKQLPSATDLRELINILLHAPKPFLVHCQGGADRSGLAAGVALILDKNAPLDQSEMQFSVRHLVLSPRSIGKQVFPYYRAWLLAHNLSHTRENFLQWVYSNHPFR